MLALLLPTPAHADGHALGAVVLGYEQPYSTALRVDAMGWREFGAFTENVVLRVQAAPLRILSFGAYDKPSLAPGQRTTVWQCDLGTLPVALGPLALGAAAALGETNTLLHTKAAGDYAKGQQSAMGVGAKAVAALHVGALGGASAAWGAVWHLGGLRQTSRDVSLYLVLNQANMYGLFAAYAHSALVDSSGSPVAEGSSWTLGLGLVRAQ
ncbi:MAG: hypothetical protein FJ100_00080 [Deltaproteobacteria bacterium]|nr:hypothetical protein [Deltaproteobacteria bacterium]